MKYLFFTSILILISGCALSGNTMKSCRSICQGGVSSYQDDTVSCECQHRELRKNVGAYDRKL